MLAHSLQWLSNLPNSNAFLTSKISLSDALACLECRFHPGYLYHWLLMHRLPCLPHIKCASLSHAVEDPMTVAGYHKDTICHTRQQLSHPGSHRCARSMQKAEMGWQASREYVATLCRKCHWDQFPLGLLMKTWCMTYDGHRIQSRSALSADCRTTCILDLLISPHATLHFIRVFVPHRLKFV